MRNIFGVKFIVAASMLISFEAFPVAGILPSGTVAVLNCDLLGVICGIRPFDGADVGVPKQVAGASASVSQGKSLPSSNPYIALTIPGMLPNTIYSLKITNCGLVPVTSSAAGLISLPKTKMLGCNVISQYSAIAVLNGAGKVVRRSATFM